MSKRKRNPWKLAWQWTAVVAIWLALGVVSLGFYTAKENHKWGKPQSLDSIARHRGNIALHLIAAPMVFTITLFDTGFGTYGWTLVSGPNPDVTSPIGIAPCANEGQIIIWDDTTNTWTNSKKESK